MEYNIITAPTLEVLASEVAGLLPMGWKLKGGIFEHSNGFAQQLIRSYNDRIKIRTQPQEVEPVKQHKRAKWIE